MAATGGGVDGDYSASPLTSSARWSVAGGSGGFGWNYPLPAVPAPGKDTPSFSLGYSSQAVDGMVASENNQPGWTGLGWNLDVPFIERRYIGCSEELQADDQPVTGYADSGDLCWAGQDLEISLRGSSSPLVRDQSAPGEVWRPRDDPGWTVERRTGGANDARAGEYWVVTTPDGTRYTFGAGRQATTNRATNSVLTVPVFGNNTGDECHAATVVASWCRQAWRWNLDSSVDAHGNETSYFYTQEKNRYRLLGRTADATDVSYERGGFVNDVEYGFRSGSETATAPARLHFTTQPRCSGIAGGGATTCPALTSTSSDADYPDVPSSQICTGTCTAAQSGPSFFTGVLLASVTSQRSSAGDWVSVDRIDLSYRYPQPSDGSSASLWLDRIQLTGLDGGTRSAPPVTFTGVELNNRVEQGAARLPKLRVASVTDELGRRVEVTYGTPAPCVDGALPAPADNATDCFPAWRVADDGSQGFGWWWKYVVTRVRSVDSTGASPVETTEYRYGGKPAWHYDDTPATPVKKQSWGDWRGYGSVDVVELSDPAYRGQANAVPLSLTRTRYFRGMDLDRAAGDPMTGPGSRRFQVTDSTGASVPDDPWLSGRTREVQKFALTGAGAADYEIAGELDSYGVARTTPVTTGSVDAKRDGHLVVPTRVVKRETVLAENGTRTTRSSTSDTTYDVYGQPLTATSTAAGAGAAGGGSDVRCTRTTYARDAATVAAGLLSLPYRVRNYAGTCASPTALVRGTDNYYDGSTTLGAPVQRGDVTRRTVAVTASGPDTVATTITATATFDTHGRAITNTDGAGRTTRHTYTPATGLVTGSSDTNPLGQVTSTTTDPGRGTVTSSTDSNGRVTRIGYDPLGKTLSVRRADQAAADPPALAFVYTLDQNRATPPRVTTRRLLSGTTYVSSYAFLDAYGRQRQSQTVSPASTASAPKAVVADTRYDDRGLEAVTALPVVVNAAAGSALSAVPAAQADENRTTYDEVGRPTVAGFYAGGTLRWRTTSQYFGDHVRTTPPTGGVVNTTWTDVRGREVRSDQGAGTSLVSTTYRYDDADQMVASTDPGGHASTRGYDLQGRAVTATDSDTGTTTTGYDPVGNLVRTTDATGTTVTTDYDALNRPTTVWKGASGGGTKLASYAYDSTSISNGIGRLAGMTSYAPADLGRQYSVAVTGYDARGRASGKSWTFPAGVGLSLLPATYTVSYGYDQSDHQTSITYPDRVVGLDPETVTSTYDPNGYLSTLTGRRTPPIGSATTDTYVSATGYAADGKLMTRDYANPFHSLRRQYSYEDGTQRLSNISTLVGGPLQGDATTAKQDDTVSYDMAGNVTKVVDAAPQLPLTATPSATCYGYDDLDRLTHAWSTAKTDCSDATSTLVHDGPSGFNESWSYTADGNVTASRSLLVNRPFSYGDAKHPHAVTGSGNAVYTYDAAGRQTSRVGLPIPAVMTYTPQQQLASVTSGVKTTRFVYAPDGTRLARLGPDGTATLYLDGEELFVVAGIAKGTRYYSLGGSVIGERLPTGTLVWQMQDSQNSAQVAVISGTGELIRTYYDPYGRVRDLSAPTTTDRGFLGRTTDALTGLDQLGARYYDPDLHRFITTDPKVDRTSAQSANPYAYAGNNPISSSDPSGLCDVSRPRCPSRYFGPSTGDAIPCGIAAVGASCVSADGTANWSPEDIATAVAHGEDLSTIPQAIAPFAVQPQEAAIFPPWIFGGTLGQGKLLQYANMYHDAAVFSTQMKIAESSQYLAMADHPKIMIFRFETGIPGGGRSKTKSTYGFADIMIRNSDGSVTIWEVKPAGQEQAGVDQLSRYRTALSKRGVVMHNGWDVPASASTVIGVRVTATTAANRPGSGVRTYTTSSTWDPAPAPAPDPTTTLIGLGLAFSAYQAWRTWGESGGGSIGGPPPVPVGATAWSNSLYGTIP